MISRKIPSLLLMTAFSGIAFGAPSARPQASHSSSSAGEAQAVFVRSCSGCHGRDGRSNTPLGHAMHAADLTSAKVQAQSNAALARFISAGGGQMPAFSNVLTSQQIADQVKYVRELAKAAKQK